MTDDIYTSLFLRPPYIGENARVLEPIRYSFKIIRSRYRPHSGFLSVRFDTREPISTVVYNPRIIRKNYSGKQQTRRGVFKWNRHELYTYNRFDESKIVDGRTGVQ